MVIQFNSYDEFSCNMYLVIKNNDALLIDFGSYTSSLKKKLDNLNLLGIILTHGHFDHIRGLAKFDLNVPIYCNEDKDFLLNPKKNGSYNFNEFVSIDKNIINLSEGHHVIGPFEFEVYFTPGHTDGGISLYFKDEHAIFFGDTVISYSVGRTDLYSGDKSKLNDSLQKISLLDFKDNDICYFGHDDKLDFKTLKKYNPYILK